MERAAVSLHGLEPTKKLNNCLVSDKRGLSSDSPAQQHIRSQLHMRQTSDSLKCISKYVNICETDRYSKIIYHKQEEELNSMLELIRWAIGAVGKKL